MTFDACPTAKQITLLVTVMSGLLRLTKPQSQDSPVRTATKSRYVHDRLWLRATQGRNWRLPTTQSPVAFR